MIRCKRVQAWLREGNVLLQLEVRGWVRLQVADGELSRDWSPPCLGDSESERVGGKLHRRGLTDGASTGVKTETRADDFEDISSGFSPLFTAKIGKCFPWKGGQTPTPPQKKNSQLVVKPDWGRCHLLGSQGSAPLVTSQRVYFQNFMLKHMLLRSGASKRLSLS